MDADAERSGMRTDCVEVGVDGVDGTGVDLLIANPPFPTAAAFSDTFRVIFC